MAALPVVTDPEPIVNVTELRLIMGGASEGAAASAPETIAALPAVAIVAAGAKLEQALLTNQRWDNFWIDVGGGLNDVWHRASNFLFHRSGAPSLDTVTQLVQLSMHVNMRATRQLVSVLASHSVAVESRLYKGVLSVARGVDALQRWTIARTGQVQATAHGELMQVVGSLERMIGQAENDAIIRSKEYTDAVRADIIRHVTNPLHSDIVKLQHTVQAGNGSVAALQSLIHTHVLPELAAAAAASAAAKALATKAAQEWDDCGEPMCETVGPKTNWGKLFHRFDAALLWALLAELAAMSPHDLEVAAEDIASVIGTPLADWAESWLGLSAGNRGADEGAVAREVGHIPGTP